MKARVVFLLLAAGRLALAPALPAQSPARWRVFTRTDGMSDNVCLNVTLGASGNVLVRHGKSSAVSVLDGYDVVNVPGPGLNRNRVYESPGGQLWSVTTDGLQEFRDGQWVSYTVPEIAEHFRSGRTNEIILLPVRQGRVLVLLPDRLLQFEAEDPEQPHVRLLRRADQSSLRAFSNVTFARDGVLWIAGAGGYERTTVPGRNLQPDQPWVATTEPPPEWTIQPVELPSPDDLSVRKIYDIKVEPDGTTWVATSDGLFRRAPQLWEMDRTSAFPVPPAVPIAALPKEVARRHGWTSSYTAKNGDLWLGSPNEIAWRHQDAWRYFTSTNQIGPENVLAFAEAMDGRIWCATTNRIWEFDGRNWVALRGGFAPIHALCGARDGTLWVATDSGVVRYTQGAWVANGPEDGLPATAITNLVETAAGEILAATAEGLTRFHPAADTQPPITLLLNPKPGENTFREGGTVLINFRGRDRWKQTAASRLLYSYRLDEQEWTPFQDLWEVPFDDLPLGKHVFQVRSMDRNANIDRKPARLEFFILVPWYRETRLVLILSVALGVAWFFAALAMNRHRKLRLSYAEVERKIAERTRDLEIANRELLHSQKMNALGTLSAGIAHDFNNILSIIKGSAQIIEDNLDRPEKIRVRLDRIKTVVQQGAGIVEAMLGFSRSSSPPTEGNDVNRVVEDTLKLLGDRFVREVEVRFRRGENLPLISVPRDFVQQVLLNFIFNAAEAMSGRKQITVTTRLVATVPPGIILSPGRAGPCIAIAVRDSGSGIAPEILPRIFEPFFTTKAMSARRGTGLGLSMVYELAKKIEAGLAVETVPGEGSTFTLFLPVPSTPAPVAAAPNPVPT